MPLYDSSALACVNIKSENAMIIPADFSALTRVPADKLVESIRACQSDLQTGLVELEFSEGSSRTLLFVRGTLSAVYLSGQVSNRLDPADWLESLEGTGTPVSLRSLSLTPEDVRIFKILIEQQGQSAMTVPVPADLEKQFNEWAALPAPALAQVRWPTAEALVLFPGGGPPPYYCLMFTSDQVKHSSGDVRLVCDVPGPCESARIFSSEPRTQAWTEYLLHLAFTNLVGSLLGRLDKLVGRLVLNQIIREVNFKATAHDWNLSVSASGVNDQAIFASPLAAAEVYSRLLEVLFHNFENVLGGQMLGMLVRDPALMTRIAMLKGWVYVAITSALLAFLVRRLLVAVEVNQRQVQEREEQLQTFFDLAVDGIFTGDERGQFIGANSRACEITGYSRDELLQKSMADLFSPEELQRAPLRYDLLQGGKQVVAERWLTRKDGSQVAIEMHSKRLPNGTHQAFVRDVTERKRAEEALRESEERYSLAARGANDGLWDWDLRSNKIYLSYRWKSMLGYGDGELSNNTDTWSSLVHPDDRERVQDTFNAYMAGEMASDSCDSAQPQRPFSVASCGQSGSGRSDT